MLSPFQGASEVPISELIRVKRATRKNSQLATAAAQRVALKMGRRLRCSPVGYQFRYTPSYRQSGLDRTRLVAPIPSCASLHSRRSR
jgi:hypothetical protein